MFLGVNIVKNGIVLIFLGIAGLFYRLIKVFANIYYSISMYDIITNDTVVAIYQRVGLLLGIFMLFKLTFSFIQMIINPDLVTDKEKGVGNIIKRIGIVILLLGLTPSLFKGAYYIQGVVLSNNNGPNLIERIVTGNYQDDSETDFGTRFSANLFSSFIENEDNRENFKDELMETENSYTDINEEESNVIYNGNDSSLAGSKLNTLDTEVTKSTGYTGAAKYIDSIGIAFLCMVTGGFACWIFFTYTISVGLRAVQLLFLELIAPVPIMSHLSTKKETALNAWIKQCITTYVDIFIRMFIIEVVILIVGAIVEADMITLSGSIISFSHNNTLVNILETSGGGWFTSLVIKIVLIWGVLLLMKKAPDMIKEMFPGLNSKAAGDFGFGMKSRKDIPEPIAKGLGLASGRAVGAVSNALANGLSVKRVNDAVAGTLKDKEMKGLEEGIRRLEKKVDDIENNPDLTRAEKDAQKEKLKREKAHRQKKLAELSKMSNSDFKRKYGKSPKYNGKFHSAIKAAAVGYGTGSIAGAKAGVKSKGVFDMFNNAVTAAAKSSKDFQEWINTGGVSSMDRFINGIQQKFGIATKAETIERLVKTLDAENQEIDNKLLEVDREVNIRKTGIERTKASLDGSSIFKKGKTLETSDGEHNYSSDVTIMSNELEQIKESYKNESLTGSLYESKNNQQYNKLTSFLNTLKTKCSGEALSKVENLINKYNSATAEENYSVQDAYNEIMSMGSQVINQSTADFQDIMGTSAIVRGILRRNARNIRADQQDAYKKFIGLMPEDANVDNEFYQLIDNIQRNPNEYKDFPKLDKIFEFKNVVETKANQYDASGNLASTMISDNELIEYTEVLKDLKKYQQHLIGESLTKQEQLNSTKKENEIVKKAFEASGETDAANADQKYNSGSK